MWPLATVFLFPRPHVELKNSLGAPRWKGQVLQKGSDRSVSSFSAPFSLDLRPLRPPGLRPFGGSVRRWSHVPWPRWATWRWHKSPVGIATAARSQSRVTYGLGETPGGEEGKRRYQLYSVIGSDGNCVIGPAVWLADVFGLEWLTPASAASGGPSATRSKAPTPMCPPSSRCSAPHCGPNKLRHPTSPKSFQDAYSILQYTFWRKMEESGGTRGKNTLISTISVWFGVWLFQFGDFTGAGWQGHYQRGLWCVGCPRLIIL